MIFIISQKAVVLIQKTIVPLLPPDLCFSLFSFYFLLKLADNVGIFYKSNIKTSNSETKKHLQLRLKETQKQENRSSTMIKHAYRKKCPLTKIDNKVIAAT